MGESQSKNEGFQTNHEIEQKLENFLLTYSKIKSFKDERYGSITLYKEIKNPKKLLILKEKWTTERNSEIEMINSIKKLKNLNENILEFQGHFKQREDNMCTSYIKHYTIFNFSLKTLKNEIELWRKKRTNSGHLMVRITFKK